VKKSISRGVWYGLAGVALLVGASACPCNAQPSQTTARTTTAIDRDLPEVTIPRLQSMYRSHKYTVTQVTRWYLQRITRHDGVYRALLQIDAAGALATAAAEDAAAKTRGQTLRRGPLWGVPVVIKGNTSVRGLVTSNGWKGYLIPGHELIAPADAPVVAKLRAAGAVILGLTNMPDFAASDTTISSAGGRTGNAYNWRYSPGGSSGGTVTAVAANFAVLGTGTDTSNSIRMPSGTSNLVGVLPTRGLVSIAGIHPLDSLLDNTGPITRTVTDAAIALAVMAGEDPQDLRTRGSAARAQRGPYTKYLNRDALKGKRFGVPAFILKAASPGVPSRALLLTPGARKMFMRALDGLRKAGATIVVDEALLPERFLTLADSIDTRPYAREGLDSFLRDFGPAGYRSVAAYEKAVGSPLPEMVTGGSPATQRRLAADPAAEKTFWGPQKQALAAYEDALSRFHLDGLVYPSAQMPPNDETIPGRVSSGPHSETGWVNRIGVPAIVVPGGFYPTGLPFGLELSARRWQDGDLLSWAFAYEQATKHRKPPVLMEKSVGARTKALRSGSRMPSAAGLASRWPASRHSW
jgi:Asp-tRNA(Asn)/Glu-tRNA(Gln) amidotransferase A subunit family amidase